MRTRDLLTAVLLAATALLGATTTANAAATIGMGDQSAQLFQDGRFTSLSKIKTVRYIAPWDVENDPAQRARADAWIAAARANGYKAHVTFNYSSLRPLKLPTPAQYAKATKAFVKRHKSQVESWGVFNEANAARSGRHATPSAKLAAQYFTAFRTKSCVGCKIVGLDLLDGQSIKPTLKYIKTFRKAAGKTQPKIWGLHNYSDVNRNSTTRTAAVLKALPSGELWLTETGGLYEFGSSFQASASRQTAGTKRVFAMAKRFKRIKRVYFYNFFGPGVNQPDDVFDAGLIGGDGSVRPAYAIFKKTLS